MKTEIVEIDGKQYNITVTPVVAERGIELPEVFALLPFIVTIAADVNKQIAAAAAGQNAALTIANCVKALLPVSWQAILYADLEATVLLSLKKAYAYANGTVSLVGQVESTDFGSTETPPKGK